MAVQYRAQIHGCDMKCMKGRNMKTQPFQIGMIPAVLYGESAEQGYLFLHGQMGCKEEAEAFAQVVCPKGYQVLSIPSLSLLPAYPKMPPRTRYDFTLLSEAKPPRRVQRCTSAGRFTIFIILPYSMAGTWVSTCGAPPASSSAVTGAGSALVVRRSLATASISLMRFSWLTRVALGS